MGRRTSLSRVVAGSETGAKRTFAPRFVPDRSSFQGRRSSDGWTKLSAGIATVRDVGTRRKAGAVQTQIDADPAADVDELTAEQHKELLDREARRLLNMSAEEFTERWNSGEFAGNDDPKVTQVAMLLPDAWT
jgi:hypothetical protein